MNLEMAMEAIGQGYPYFEVCGHFHIPRSSLRNHTVGKTTSRKMEPSEMLSIGEEHALSVYIEDMAE